ncbi:hypothetical protein SAMN05444392_103293 [Seinonella peptonophila]|uniref:Uncharacterized protein n=1 Tax=Seinonella peptonophila TaxID=112248 RepID=A0A1M4WMR6_9BACL|nr:hypothetical protein [Seinonella peptonophila]SHE82515.1 hypothetical protein SAMN05444392_103293 [Seinonella peptonophila]
MRRRFIFLISLIFCSLISFPQYLFAAPASTIELHASVGFQGEYKDELIPVQVEVKNKGDHFQGKIQIRTDQNNQRESASIERSIDLSPGTTKMVQLMMPADLDPAYVTVLDGNQSIVSTRLVPQKLLQNTTIGIVSDQATAVQQIRNQATSTNGSTRIYDLKLKDIPIHGQIWSGLDVLVIDPLQEQSLSVDQIKAIETWVWKGGKLLVGGGKSTAYFGAFERFLPMKLLADTGSLQAKATPTSPEKNITYSKNQMQAEGKVMLTLDQQALISKRTLGEGRIYVAAYPLSQASLADLTTDSRINQELYSYHRDQASEDRSPLQGKSITENNSWAFLNALKNQAEKYGPSKSILITFFLTYLLGLFIIYFWIRYRKKQVAKLWLVIPITSILFSVLYYVYSDFSRGWTLPIYQYGYAILDNSGQAKIRAYTSFISGSADEYEVETKQSFAYPMLRENETINSSKKEVAAFLDPDQDASIRFPDVPQWTMRSFLQEGIRSLGGTLQAKVEEDGNGMFSIDVINQTKFPIKDVSLFVKNHQLHVGDLQPKQSKVVQMSKKDYEQWIRTSYGQTNTWSLTKYRRNMVEELFRSEPLVVKNDINVVGWVHQPLLPSQIKDHSSTLSGEFMVVGNSISVANQQKEIFYSQGLLKPEVISASDEYSIYNNDGKSQSVQMSKPGEVIFSFTLDHQMESLSRIELTQVNPSFAVNQGKTIPALKSVPSWMFEFYNWKTNKWEYPINQMDKMAYLSPNQEIHLRVIGAYFSLPSLIVEGRVH